MKYLLAFILLAAIACLTGCRTTTTTSPDGTVTRIVDQDPKAVKAISSAVAEAATKAAIEAIQQQVQKQQDGNP